VARSFLTRSAIKSGRYYTFSSSAVTSKYLGNIPLGPNGPHRLFSVSTRLASPVAAKTTTVKKSATKTPVKKKTATTTKKKATITATKRKTTTAKKTKKAAPKKRKVAAKRKTAKKTRVSVRRRKVKKVVPKKPTPRTDASLRPPPRYITPMTLYVQRMWPTLSPKPAKAPEGMVQLHTMWKALNALEKQPFIDEATVITEQRSQAYEKWRAGLSRSEVIVINASRKNTKHHKLGRITTPGVPKKPVKGYLKFYSEALKNGTIDIKKTPEGTRRVVYASGEAGKLWKSMTPEQKKPYL